MKNGIIKTIAFAGILGLFFACEKDVLSVPSNQNNTNTTTTHTPQAIASCTIQENNDSIFVCDSVYWCYESNGCAVMKGFSGANKKVTVFLCQCGNLPLVSGTFHVDEIGGSPHYYNYQKSYKVQGAQPILIRALSGNMVSGNFDHNMSGSIYVGLVNTINGPAPSYLAIPGIRLKVIWENVPFRP